MNERPWKGISFLVLDEAGVTIDDDGLTRIPYRLCDGCVFRERFVAPNGRTWWGPGTQLIPFGLETLPDADQASNSALFLCEGESDTLAAREAFAGVPADSPIDAYFAVGLPGAGAWRSEWALLFEDFDVIYLLGDGDPAGRAMIDAVYRDLPWSRPVWFPEGEDVRSVLQSEGPRALDPYLDRADQIARLCVAFFASDTYAEFVRLMTDGARGVAA